MVLDQNTAIYSLHLYGGAGETFQVDNPRGGKITLQVVGLLENSIFQGDLIISEQNFQRLFSDTSGYRFFLNRRANDGSRRGADSIANYRRTGKRPERLRVYRADHRGAAGHVFCRAEYVSRDIS